MFKIEYDEIVILTINNFINGYLNSFLARFNDSGIFNEDIIINNYTDKSFGFKKEIFDKIEDIFGNSEILGYKPLKNNKRKSGIIVGNYRIFIEYIEEEKIKTRFIEKIEFNKK